jgi:hypothetical protein
MGTAPHPKPFFYLTVLYPGKMDPGYSYSSSLASFDPGEENQNLL